MHKLSFLADMNISPLTVRILKEKGWDIIRVSEVIGATAKDNEIIDYAREHSMVIITQDLDFSSLIAIAGYQKPSLINLRIDNAKPDFIAKHLIEIIPEIENILEDGAIVTIDEITVRYRMLPIEKEEV